MPPTKKMIAEFGSGTVRCGNQLDVEVDVTVNSIEHLLTRGEAVDADTVNFIQQRQ